MVFSTWWWWVLVVLVLSVVAMILFAGRRSVKDPGTVAGEAMVRATRRIAWVYVAICLVSGLGAAGATLWGRTVAVRLPVEQFRPTLPENVHIESSRAVVESGGFSWADVNVSGLDMDARLMLTGSILAQAVLAVVAGLVIAGLCTSVMNKTLFAPRLIKGVQQVAGVAFLGGLIWQACQIFGRNMAAEQVLGFSSATVQGSIDAGTNIRHIVGMPSVAFVAEFNLWPIGVALVLMVLAELFRQGSKVQKDAAGLI